MDSKHKPGIPGILRPKDKADNIDITAAQINAARIIREFPVEVNSEPAGVNNEEDK